MPDFSYQALTNDKAVTSGRIAAESAAAAVALLEAQDLLVLMIRQLAEGESQSEAIDLGLPSTEHEEDILLTRAEQLLERRATLAPALAAFAAELPGGRSRRELQRFAHRLAAGAPADELFRSPTMIANWLPLLSGNATLGSTGYLRRLFAEAGRESAIRLQRARIFAYPLAVGGLALAVLAVLSVTIVPILGSILDDFGLELPDLTRLLLAFSHKLRTSPAFVAALVALLTAGYFLVRWVVTSGTFDMVFAGFTKGSSRQVTAMASFTQRLAEALISELSLPAALRLAGRASESRWLNRQAQQLANDVEMQPTPPWRSKLPRTLIYALTHGPRGGPNVRLIQELSQMYTERVAARFDWTSGALPHLAIVAVGIVVLFVVVALYQPLVELLTGLTG